MNFFILTISLLIVKFASGNANVNSVHEKLWSNIEHKLEELTKKQELQKSKINGLKGLLREEGINFTHNSILNDENDNDPYAYAIISSIKSDFDLLKSYYNQAKTVDVTKSGLLQTANHNFTDLRYANEGEYLLPSRPKEYCSLGGADYEFIKFTGTTEFRFKLRALSSGYIALAYRPLDVHPMYVIIIGGHSNSKSIIRKNNVEVAQVSHGKILNGCEFKDFWIRWNDGVIRVGFESDIKPFLQYNATDLYKVNYIGLKTYDKVGNWIIY